MVKFNKNRQNSDARTNGYKSKKVDLFDPITKMSILLRILHVMPLNGSSLHGQQFGHLEIIISTHLVVLMTR